MKNIKQINKALLFLTITSAVACGGGGGQPPNNTPINNMKFTTITAPKNTEHGKFLNNHIYASEAQVSSNMWHDRETKKVAPMTPFMRSEAIKAFKEINKYRAQVGLQALIWDEKLAAYATLRAQELVSNLSHTRPDGTYFSSELIIQGIVGENAAGGPSQGIEVAEKWKKSPTHYNNIVNNGFNKTGLALVIVPNKNGKHIYYWTQIFANNSSHSPYEFDTNEKSAPPDIISIMGHDIKLINHKVSLSNGKSFKSHSAKAYDRGELKNKIYKNSIKYSNDDFEIIVQDPSTAGFEYQTFGEIVDKNSDNNFAVQYINIGDPTIPERAGDFKATYKGAVIGNSDQKLRVYADVMATIENKKMNIEFTNTRFSHTGKDKTYRFTPSLEKSFNFKEEMNWSAEKGRFEKSNQQGDAIYAHFYGDQGQEIGGQFTKNIEKTRRYQGAFGAKKQ